MACPRLSRSGAIARSAAFIALAVVLTAGCSEDGAKSGETELVDASVDDTTSEPLCDKTIVINDPAGLRSQGPYLQIGVFEYFCPSDTSLSMGDLGGGIVYDYFPQSAACSYSPTPHAIAVLIRAADCAVIAYGCAAADFAQSGEIAIELKPAPQPNKGKCTIGEQCVAGDCKPAQDSGPSR